MTEEEKGRSVANPADLWMKWYEASTKMWSDAMRSAPEGQTDPWGLYRQWIESMEEARGHIAGSFGKNSEVSGQALRNAEAIMRPMGGVVNPERIREFSEQMARSWQRSLGLGMDMMGLAPRWGQMMEQAQKSMAEAVDPETIMDPLQLVVQWYNATSGPLGEFVKDIVEQEEFLEPSSRFLQSYARFYKVFGQASEQYLNTLQFPTRSDVSRVASLVVALEDKVDRIEEALEDFEYGYAEPATAEEVKSVENRIDRLDRELTQKLDESAAGTEGYATAESVSGLEERVDRIEDKLDRLLEAVGSLEAAPSASTGSNSSTESEQMEVQATEAARRKAQELEVDLAEVNGTGSGGQITVDDVRKKGES